MLKPPSVPKLKHGMVKPRTPQAEHKTIPKKTILTQKRKLLK